MARPRYAKDDKPQNVFSWITPTVPAAKCKPGCVYAKNYGICCYYLDTGIRRPCPAGKDCTVYKRGEPIRKNPAQWED